jgi:hypothetical protein
MRQAVKLIDSAVNTMEGGEIFIPQLPACMVETLAEAAFPGHAPHLYTGLRPGGEKRHELLMSGEEAARAVDPHDFPGVSIVLPHLRSPRGPRSAESSTCTPSIRTPPAPARTACPSHRTSSSRW